MPWSQSFKTETGFFSWVVPVYVLCHESTLPLYWLTFSSFPSQSCVIFFLYVSTNLVKLVLTRFYMLLLYFSCDVWSLLDSGKAIDYYKGGIYFEIIQFNNLLISVVVCWFSFSFAGRHNHHFKVIMFGSRFLYLYLSLGFLHYCNTYSIV